MISISQWRSLKRLNRSDFKYQDYVDWSIVSALDSFADRLGVTPQILSDYRPGDPKQHGFGLAVDCVFPGVEPLHVWNEARTSFLFSGLGIYLNEKGTVSFHFDLRSDRSVSSPALWGDHITHVRNPSTGIRERRDNYTSADSVLSAIGSNAGIAGLMAIGAFAYVLYKAT